MFYVILYGLPKNVHLMYSFIHVFIHNSSQSIIGKILQNFCQRRLEKPLFMSNSFWPIITYSCALWQYLIGIRREKYRKITL